MKENTQNHLIGIGKATCKLGNLKECDGTHSERSARKVPTLRNLRKHRTNKHICGTSLGFRWLLGFSQVARWLGDHFATTVSYLWASCITVVLFLGGGLSAFFFINNHPLSRNMAGDEKYF